MNEKSDFENEDGGFVNRKRRGEDPPDYLTDQLDFNPNTDLKQIAVLREMYQGERPFYSLSQLEGRFDVSDRTVENRLNEMDELGVLDSGVMNNGRYWWINWEISEYPIPPDVEVMQERDEETVSEFFDKLHIQFVALSLLTTVIGGAIVWVGTLQTSGAFSLPFPASEILSIGLLTQAVAYVILLMAVVVWVFQRMFEIEDEFEGIF